MKPFNHGMGALLLVPWLASTVAVRADELPTPPSDVSRQDGSLSHKLDANEGVIHPESDIDPGMQKTPPATGTSRIVPPPGTPGGRPDVVPK